MLKSTLLPLALVALTGCSALEQYPAGRLVTDVEKGHMVGSFIQWNEDYAVTANHVPNVGGVVYTCETRCDLKFFRHKAEEKLPQWRHRVPNEDVVVSGSTASKWRELRRGQDLNTSISSLREGGTNSYYTANTDVVGGMSGGPVYGGDKQVIGMTLGVADVSIKGKASRITIYLPYAMVQKEWQKYQVRRHTLLAADE